MLFGLSVRWNTCCYMFDFTFFYRLRSQINDDDDDDDEASGRLHLESFIIKTVSSMCSSVVRESNSQTCIFDMLSEFRQF